jgi:cellulose synthase/poly-beta-1,6-N-acetylglucosamine synthase-like glycosyltransferase
LRKPFVSVTVCVRNGAVWVDHCLHALSNQLYEAFEIIVVDDGSTDETPNELRKWDDPMGVRGPKIKILKQGPLGLSAARQYAIEHASGEWIAITDIDVRPEPNWISHLMNAYQSSSEDERVVAVTGRTMFGIGSDPVSLLRSVEIDRKYKSRTRYTSLANGPCSMFKKSSLDNIGGFGKTWYHAEDMEVSLKLLLNGDRILYAPEAIVHHVPETGLKRFLGKRKRDARAHTRIIRKYPKRKRAKNSFDFLGSSFSVILATLLFAMMVLTGVSHLTMNPILNVERVQYPELFFIFLFLFECVMWTGTLGSVHFQSLKHSTSLKIVTSIQIRIIIILWGIALIAGILQGSIDAVFAKHGHPRLFSKRV